MSVLDKIVSYYPDKNSTTQGVDANLLTILQSTKHRDLIINLRASPEEVQKQLKELLPCYTVAGRFWRRSKSGLIELSGLADVDLDSAGDCDIQYLLTELRQVEFIAYAGLSCRGNRLHCIVSFLYPEKYAEHYEALIRSFREYGLPMGDECHKQISQPRFVSLNDDNTQFFNHTAKPYPFLPVARKFHFIKRNPKSYSGAPDNPFQWCNEQINKSHTFQEKERHEYIIQLARYCNQKGLQQEETLSGCLGYIQSDFTEEEITKIVKHIYTTQTDSHNKYPFTEKKTQPQTQSIIEKKPEEKIQEEIIIQKTPEAIMSEPLPEKWDKEIAELETFFQSITLPTTPVKLNAYSTITDVSAFIQSHLSVVKTNNGNKTFEPYLQRLFDLKLLFLPK